MAAKNADPTGPTFNEDSFEAGTQDWIATCGVCHVGGGQMEYDRNGNPYSNDGLLADGTTPTQISPPGDRYIFRYPTKGNESPVITLGYMDSDNKAEMDCLMCHLDYSAPGGDGQNGNGRALLQTWGCSSDNAIGPANDTDCNGVDDAGADTSGYLAAGQYAAGTAYDMFNRNYALKSERLDLAASMGIGAVGLQSDATTPTGRGAVGIDATLATIEWQDGSGNAITTFPIAIKGDMVPRTPKSANCAPCHARDEDTVGLKGMYTMKAGFGNYLLSFDADDVLDTDNGPTATNDTAWLDFGCKTGMGKRAHKIGMKDLAQAGTNGYDAEGDDTLGTNRRYGRTWFFPSTADNDPATTPNVGDLIQPSSVDPATGLAQLPVQSAFDPATPAGEGTHLVNPGAQMFTRAPMAMPDVDVHDVGGMSCASCHYALGTENRDATPYAVDNNDELAVDAGTHHGVDYPAEIIKSMDHQFAQGDSYPDTKGKNNLDETVSCESCHTWQGTAHEHPRVASMATKPPVPLHQGFPAQHLHRIACATCHIPETYNAPGRLKYRDWSVGIYKGGFRHMLDWNYDLVTGSHRPSPVLHQWLTKYGETKIYPILPSVMPIWFETLSSEGTEAGSAGLEADGITTAADEDLDPWGDAYVAFTDPDTGDFIKKHQPMKSRDVTSTALMVQNVGSTDTCDTGTPSSDQMAALMYAGTCTGGTGMYSMGPEGAPCNTDVDCRNRFDIRINGGNAVPLFDGFSLADAWEIDTQYELDAMIGAFAQAGRDAKLVLKQTNFDVTHGVVPSEWALGGTMRGGCISCHSSKAPNVDFATGMPTNPAFSPYSVGFFEGFAQPMEMAGQLVGGYDVVKNWFSLFSAFNCTEVCGMNPMLEETTYFEDSGVPKWGAKCAPNSMLGAMSMDALMPPGFPYSGPANGLCSSNDGTGTCQGGWADGAPCPGNGACVAGFCAGGPNDSNACNNTMECMDASQTCDNATIDMCVGMMTFMFDSAMQFPKGSAMNMGMYDGVAGLAGFVVKEGVKQGHNGCDPFAGPASLSTYGGERNANNCVVAGSSWDGTSLDTGVCDTVTTNTCTSGAFAGAPCSSNAECPDACADGFRMGKIAMALSDCQGTLSATDLTTDSNDTLIYTRAEVLSHFKVDLQQTVNGNGVGWDVGGEKNPYNTSHINSWDQAQVCVDRDTQPIDAIGFVPGTRPCNSVFPSADMMGMLTGNPTPGATCGSGNPMTGAPAVAGVCDGGIYANGWDPATQQFGVATCGDQDGTGLPSADCPWGMNDGMKHVSTIIPANKYLGYTDGYLRTLMLPPRADENEVNYFATATAITPGALSYDVDFDASNSQCGVFVCDVTCQGGTNVGNACTDYTDCPGACTTFDWEFTDIYGVSLGTDSGVTVTKNIGNNDAFRAKLTVGDGSGITASTSKLVAGAEVVTPTYPTLTGVGSTDASGTASLTIVSNGYTVLGSYIDWRDKKRQRVKTLGPHSHTYTFVGTGMTYSAKVRVTYIDHLDGNRVKNKFVIQPLYVE